MYLSDPIILCYLNTAICDTQCDTNMECTAPNTCTCMTGWTGNDCLTGILNYLHSNIVNFILLAICNPVCGINKECTTPNNCTCVSGWDGYNCLSGNIIFV